MSEQDGFERFMERWSGEYNRPPETPREEIWEGIRAALWKEGQEGEKVVPLRAGRRRTESGFRRSWWSAAVAAAAVLVLGFGLGRLTAPDERGASDTVGIPETARGSGSFHAAALGHFSDTESFLTLVRGDARAGRVAPELEPWAGSLLTETRLLLDSPAAEDPAVKALLEDLELILVQVVGLEGSDGTDVERGRRELELIAAGIDDQAVLPRLQAFAPEGLASAGP